MMAALASAAVPGIAVAGVRDSEQRNATDLSLGIDQAVVQDAAGKVYDILACDTETGKRRLARRVRAARTLTEAREPAGLGFAMDQVLAFEDGSNPRGRTGETAVMVALHHQGGSRPLNLLTLDDCASVGTAIGAIHRLRAGFLKDQGYPIFTTAQIQAQLVAWITRLRQAGHIPASITSSWSQILQTEGLWSFSTCMVHGGFAEGDLLFSGSTLASITNWQDMQVNDPARDLAWTFAKLDETHRNAVLTAYGRMMGSRLDDLIMLRANLWLQMEQVGDFIQALNAADTNKIMQFKAQVERLAHQLVLVTQQDYARRSSTQSSGHHPPSTITVGTLLNDTQHRGSAQRSRQAQQAAQEERAQGTTDSTADRLPHAAPSTSSSATIAINTSAPESFSYGADDSNDALSESDSPQSGTQRSARPATNNEASSETVVIPLLEREERALRDAREGLESAAGMHPAHPVHHDEGHAAGYAASHDGGSPEADEGHTESAGSPKA